jgi:hypothetical protein
VIGDLCWHKLDTIIVFRHYLIRLFTGSILFL